ncbi:HIT-type Zinc finger family protein [Raphanus sativus]|nr:HIT-type Zinc finger family protein [Raphanus sativus]
MKTPCAKPSSLTEENPATSPAKQVTTDVVRPNLAVVMRLKQRKFRWLWQDQRKQSMLFKLLKPQQTTNVSNFGSKPLYREFWLGVSSTKEVPVARPIIVEDAKYVVDKTELEAIASSSEIREALKDEALQKLITNIDRSSNPLKALDEAMGDEAFRILKDKILLNLSKKK